ncbi:MAG: mercuric transporter MerT family protein [bacterium]
MKKLPIIGSLLSAFLASVCCVGPVIFAALGVGAGATGILAMSADLATSLVPFRPLFIGFSILFLGFAFYSVYRKKVAGSSEGCSCDVKQGSRIGKRSRSLIWVMAAIAMVLIALPYFL